MVLKSFFPDEKTLSLDITMLSARISDYPTITQGKTRIPGINDGEEFEYVDVSCVEKSFLQVETLVNIEKAHKWRKLYIQMIKERVFSWNVMTMSRLEFFYERKIWKIISYNFTNIFKSPQQICVSFQTISMTTSTSHKVKLQFLELMMVKKWC